MFFRFSILILFSVFFISCNQYDNGPIHLDDEKELISFQFEQEFNSSLSETVVGVIHGSTIRLTIPDVIDTKSLIATFEYEGEAIYVNDELQESGITQNDFSKPIIYEVHAENGSVKTYDIKVILLPDVQSKVPHIYINTDENAPIDSKEEYVWADIEIEGKGVYDDFQGRTKIRGRGNDSWNQPKKPYKLKLDAKASLLGLLPEKKWILRSNYRAESLMLDAVAFRMASLLDMPYTQHAIPVDITINGEYVGSYIFTEQKEAKENRINVVDGGLYLNLDVYMHKPPGLFYSDYFDLPVMIRYPKLDEVSPTELASELSRIKSDFHIMEEPIADNSFPDNNYLDNIDIDEFVNYMIVYNLSLNQEINHPKSTYMHKHKDGKYKMGPVWDFDWAFGYNSQTNTHFNNPNQSLLLGGDMIGDVFFSRIMEDPVVQTRYKERWEEFKNEKYAELITYIMDYAETISESYDLDYAVWGQGVGSADLAAQQLIDWLDQRVQYMDAYVADF